ncbi:MAG TPA: serine/threonine-protein kinase [Polyangium sp.]|nr:serine/threonine-protein kinase [Polyangium sp.]
MQLPKAIEQQFHERVTSRALADTLAHFPPQRTISARTLAEVSIGAAATLAGAREVGVPTATINLPRIALEHRSQPGQTAHEATGSVDFEIIGLLGEGGMGRVYHTRQHSLARDVAVKIAKDNENAAMAARGLLQEGRIMGSLEHPGIVPVHALGLDDSGRPVLVMKRIEGVTLRVLLDDFTHPGWKSISMEATNRIDACISVLMRICQSLAFAHNHGIVHRDIKPENIMIGDYGETYLCDWGVAARIEEANASLGLLVGTPAYMAPEMLFGVEVDARTDVYLLGATLHEILTGRTRHVGSTMGEILGSIAVSAPHEYEATIAPELARLCNWATSSDPAQRPPSADAFRKELAEYMHHRSAMVLCDAALERVRALESLLSDNAVPKELAVAYRHATEARFGFTQSLRIHPHLEVAKRGLERSVVAMVELELRQGHLETAAALLDELPNPPAEIVTRLAAAHKEADVQRMEAERLRAIARDLDPTIAARSRMLVLGVTAIWSMVIAIGIFVDTSQRELTPLGTVFFSAVWFVVCAIIYLVLHKKATETLFNRRMVSFLFCVVIFLFGHRVIAWRDGDTVSQILKTDMLMYLALTTVGALTFERRLFVVTAICALCLLVVLLHPAGIVWYFQVMTFSMIPAVIWVWRAPHTAIKNRDEIKMGDTPPKS